jgi:protein gp37
VRANPSIGCDIVSPGCTSCYAMRQARRLESNPLLKPNPYKGTTKKGKKGPVWTGLVRMAPDKTVLKPLGWRAPALVFVNSMSDVFAEPLKFSDIARIWAVMALAQQHTFQVLTKRPERMLEFLSDPRTPAAVEIQMHAIKPGSKLPEWPLTNVWCGTSTEDQKRAQERIPILLQVPAAVRFLSMEPLIGGVSLSSIMSKSDWKKLGWVIVGGESGPHARGMHPQWARQIRDACAKHRVPFFYKQTGSGAWVPDRRATEFLGLDGLRRAARKDRNCQGIKYGSKKSGGRTLDGKMHEAMPSVFSSFAPSS